MNEHLLLKLEKVSKINNAQGIVALYLLNNNQLQNVTINTIVKECYVSISTPTRLAKTLGYDGFKELKYELINVKKNVKKISENTLNVENYANQLNDSLKKTLQFVDDNILQEVVEMIFDCSKLNIFAIADTSLVAKDFTYKLERLNKNISCYSDYHLQQVYAKLSTDTTLAMGISYSGTTSEVLENLKISKEQGSKTILITSRDIQKDYIDIVINVSTSEHLSRKYSMISRITILMILDFLYLKYIKLNEEENEKWFTTTRIKK